ncbi:MAG: hypothetical protein D3924_01680 [Candidatus Electrothrix sp. AR4]|nr:hypothetical protein [Candidatus Electrothrix sp. AR4]
MKEQEAGRPHRWTSPVPRENKSSNDRLYLKQKKGADKNRDCKRNQGGNQKNLTFTIRQMFVISYSTILNCYAQAVSALLLNSCQKKQENEQAVFFKKNSQLY